METNLKNAVEQSFALNFLKIFWNKETIIQNPAVLTACVCVSVWVRERI